MKVLVILLAGSDKQNICFWPTYKNCKAGYPFDLLVSHLDGKYLPEDENSIIFFDETPDSFSNCSAVKMENKIQNGQDIPHKAFGAYRHWFQKYYEKYHHDLYVFISDDVLIRRDNWLKDIVDTLNIHELCGFGASQIFNQTNYPHPSHIRAPFWFAKRTALEAIKWEFDSDHDGEMKIADQLTHAGFFGIQVGSKIDLAYDTYDNNCSHITTLMEQKYFMDKALTAKFKEQETDMIRYLAKPSDVMVSPFSHIPDQNVIRDLQPYHGLIYSPSIHTASKCVDINYINGAYIYTGENN